MAGIRSEQIFSELFKMVQDSGNAVFDVANALAAKIKQRTRSGISSSGSSFAPYSKRYAAKKGATLVNLTGNQFVSRHGGPRMLDSMAVRGKEGLKYNVPAGRFIGKTGRFQKFDNVELELGFNEPGARQRAAIHEFGARNIPPRPFFGFTDEEAATLGEVFAKSLYKPKNTKHEITIRLF